MDVKSVGFLTVATNKYVHYWKDLAFSLDEVAQSNSKINIVMHVFTDDVAFLREISANLKNIAVNIYAIPAYAWPEASLYRFRIFSEYHERLEQDLLIHLDADMIVQEWFIDKIPQQLVNGIALVRHPGFFRPAGNELIHFYRRNPRYLWKDFFIRIRIGALGSWETDRLSRAYVARNQRKIYVCGGTWMGMKASFLNLIQDLATSEILETSEGKTPKWHDESFLNHWSSNNQSTILTSSFCFDPTYPQLAQVEELIRAVRKNP